MSIKIVLADDHKIMRDGLRSLIEMESDMEVVAEAAGGRAAVRLSREVPADLVIMDITMPDLNGIEATRQILSQAVNVRILALSMHSDDHFVIGMLKAGASGYLFKGCAADDLIHAIRAIVAGETYLSPKITSIVVEGYHHILSKNKTKHTQKLTTKKKRGFATNYQK